MKRAQFTLAVILSLSCVPIAAADTWKFLVYGDSRASSGGGINTTILTELANQTLNEHPAFVLFPGDLVGTGGLSIFGDWKTIMLPVYNAGIGVCPVAGNHDVGDLTDFKRIFISPLASSPFSGASNVVIDSTTADGRSYSFNYRNALFLGLDNYANGSTSTHAVNQTFVNARLTARVAATTPLVFAFDHEPAFKPGQDTGLEANAVARNAFWQSLKNAGCREFFAGHDHIYAHAELLDSPSDGDANNDVHQVVVGTAGAPLYTTSYSGNTGNWTVLPISHDDTHYGYVKVVVDETARTVTQSWIQRTGTNTFNTAGADFFTYSYPVPEPCTLALAAAGLGWLLVRRSRKGARPD